MHKVVIADDEYMVKLGIRALIEREASDFSVVGEAENGQEAIKLISELAPDLLITDIRMPIMDGIELIRELNHLQCHTEVVVISGYSEFKYAQEAMRYGAIDYLLKPIETDSLLAMLNRLRVRWRGNALQQGEIAKQSHSAELFVGSHELIVQFEENDCWGYKHIVTESIAIIESQFADSRFCLKDLALEYRLTPAYFSYMFKKVTGTSFIQYLTRLRMERAKALLSDPNYKIYAVGYAAGYREYSHFTKMFKKYAGITPTEFRQNLVN